VKIYKPVGPSGIRSFENTKPVFVPDSLDDLRGPTAGRVTLPLHIDWTPSNTYDLSDAVNTCTMYATVLREAKARTTCPDSSIVSCLCARGRLCDCPILFERAGSVVFHSYVSAGSFEGCGGWCTSW